MKKINNINNYAYSSSKILLKKSVKYLLKHKKILTITLYSVLIIMIGLLAITIIFFHQILSIIFSITLFILGCLSSTINRKVAGSFNIGIEFIPIAGILFFYAHGIYIGLLLTIIMTIISSILGGSLSINIFVSWIAYLIIALTSLVLHAGISVNGLILVAEYHFLCITLVKKFNLNLTNAIISATGNIFISYVFFRFFGDFILKLL